MSTHLSCLGVINVFYKNNNHKKLRITLSLCDHEASGVELVMRAIHDSRHVNLMPQKIIYQLNLIEKCVVMGSFWFLLMFVSFDIIFFIDKKNKYKQNSAKRG